MAVCPSSQHCVILDGFPFNTQLAPGGAPVREGRGLFQEEGVFSATQRQAAGPSKWLRERGGGGREGVFQEAAGAVNGLEREGGGKGGGGISGSDWQQ